VASRVGNGAVVNLVNRRSVVVALVLLAGLAFVGRWLVSRDAPPEAPPGSQVASINPPAAEPPQTPPSVEAEAATASAMAPPSSSLATFRGRVTDAVTHQPVREFEVAFHRTQWSSSSDPPGARVYQSEDGRFEWRGVAPGAWLLTVSARGYQRFELEGVIPNDVAPRELIVPMRPGYALRGRVYDEASGAGIAAADVSFREAQESLFGSNWRSRPRIVTRKDGTFALESLPPGRIKLMVNAREYAGRELEVLVGDDMPPVEVGLAAGASIAGRLTAADGVTPVEGQVGLYSLATQSGGMGKTDSAGEFKYQHLEPGNYRLVGRSGAARVEQEITLAPNQGMEGVVLALKASASIRGVVSGLRPEELKRVSLSVHRDDGLEGHEFFTNNGVDRNGAFEVQGVAPGRVRVVADFSMRRQVWKAVDMPATGDAYVELDFGRGARLSGRVTRGGQPLANTLVIPMAMEEETGYSYGTRTSAQGEYAVGGLSNGEYRVRVEGYPSRFVQVSGDTVFNIDLPTASLIGRVLEERGDAPIVGADVELRPAQGARYRWVGRSDHLGRFNLRGVETGDFVLTVYRPGYDVVRERITYDPGQPEPTIRLRRVPGVEIRVRTKDGFPEDLYVSEVLGETTGNAFPIHLDANGVGALPNGFAGGTLSFQAVGYAPTVVRNWGGERLDLQLARATAGTD
jgi:Carboxypeptidase regulatory-like domain